MTTRNLTKKYFEFRNGIKALKRLDRTTDHSSNHSSDDSDNELLQNFKSVSNPLHDNSDNNGINASLPPIWVDIIESAENDIVLIEAKIKQLTGMHTERLMVNFEVDESMQEHLIGNVI